MTSVAKWSKFFEEYQLGIVCFIMLTFTWYQQTLFGFDFYIGYLTVPITIGLLANKPFKLFNMNKQLALFVAIFVTYNLFALYNSPNNLFLLKSLVSMVIFIFFVVIIFNYTIQLKDEHWEKLPRSMFYTLVIFCFFSFIEFFYPELWPAKEKYHLIGQFSGFFLEPSYYVGFSFIAFLIAVNDNEIFYRKISYVLWLAVALLSLNSTYVVLTISAICLIIYNFSKYTAIFMIILMVTLTYFDLENTNFLASLFPQLIGKITAYLIPFGFNYETKAPYLTQGILDAYNSLSSTNLIGVGFNRMGSLPRYPSVILEKLSSSWPGVNHNLTDGSFLLCKMVYELGILAIIFFAIILFLVFKNIYKRPIDFKSKICVNILFSCLVLFCVRSNVYAHYFIIIIAMIYLIKNSKYDYS